MRFATAALCAIVLLGAAAPPPAPPPPKQLPQPRDPGWGALLDDREDWAAVPLGVGRFGPAEPGPGVGTDWLRQSLLPVYRQPGDKPEGWIARGWWVSAAPGHRPEPLPLDCFVETHYETASLVVHELREDGWFRFGLQPPCAGGGSFWTHSSYLAPADVKLEVERWDERFRSDRISPLFFRNREQRHALRSAPDPGAERIAWISAEDTFKPLEFRGDWMRVRVKQPSDYCEDPARWKGRVLEGWIRWRGTDKGPWVWYYTRGC